MAWIKEIDESDVLIGYEIDFQVLMKRLAASQKSSPHQHDCLEMFAIAVPKSGGPARCSLTSLGMEALLELIQDQQHLALRWQAAPSASLPANRSASILGTVQGTRLSQALEQPSFGLLRGRLDVDRKDVLAEPGQESGLHQRRLSATRWTVESAPP